MAPCVPEKATAGVCHLVSEAFQALANLVSLSSLCAAHLNRLGSSCDGETAAVTAVLPQPSLPGFW